MSENEKRLRSVLQEFAAMVARPAEDYTALLDETLSALLAEHRAEVEGLKAAVEAAVQTANLARVAAQEEVASIFDERAAVARAYVAVTNDARARRSQAAAAESAEDDAITIRALKSRPASVVPVEKVREVLAALYGSAKAIDSERLGGGQLVTFQVRKAADLLGINLDAVPDVQP